MQKRAKRVVIGALILLSVGVLYSVLIRFTSFGIPCVFNVITGLKCPGCGVTAMLSALIRFDFKTAFYANQVLFCLLPVGVALAARYIYLYIRRGTLREKKTEIVTWVLIALLVVWGVVRNII